MLLLWMKDRAALEFELVGFVQGEEDSAEHFGFWGGFAGPDFELAGTLVDEHFYALDGGDASRLRGLEEWGVQRVVDQVEDKFGVPLVGFERERVRTAGHAAGGGVDEDVEMGLGDLAAVDGCGVGVGG